MSIFSYIRSIYALDTLDTRFTNASSTSYQTVVDTRAETAIIQAKRDDSVVGSGGRLDRRGRPLAQPSLWRTKEFMLYYVVFATIVPYMFWIAYDVSRRKHCILLDGTFLISSSFGSKLPQVRGISGARLDVREKNCKETFLSK